MVAVSLIWGANFSANKYALGSIPPVAFAASRFAIASILLFALVRYLEPGQPVPARRAWAIAGLGVIGNTCYQALFMIGLTTTTAINSSLILAGVPTVVAVLGTVLGVERASAGLWLGIVVATAGVILVIAARGVSFDAATLRGDLLILLAGFCWAAFTVGIRHAGRGLDPLRVTALATYGGMPGLVLASWPRLIRTDWLHLTSGTWIALAFSSVFSIVVAYTIWSYAVQGIGGSRTALYNCVIPVFAALVAWFVLGERPVVAQGFGAALVFVGVYLSQRAPTTRFSAQGSRIPGVPES